MNLSNYPVYFLNSFDCGYFSTNSTRICGVEFKVALEDKRLDLTCFYSCSIVRGGIFSGFAPKFFSCIGLFYKNSKFFEMWLEDFCLKSLKKNG